MAIVEETTDRTLERQQELENAQLLHQFEMEKKAFNLKQFEIKVVHREATRVRARRYDATVRVCIAIAKVPALLVFALLVPLLVLAGREVPRFVQEFMTL